MLQINLVVFNPDHLSTGGFKTCIMSVLQSEIQQLLLPFEKFKKLLVAFLYTASFVGFGFNDPVFPGNFFNNITVRKEQALKRF